MNKKSLLVCLVLLICFVLFKGSNFFSHVVDGSTTKVIITEKREPVTVNSQALKSKVIPRAIPILMYHSISDEKNNDAVISPQRFKEQMEYLFRHNYHPITFDELYAYLTNEPNLPDKPVVITFDDGYRDTYQIALPILKQYAFKSVLFIPTGEVGKRLSWQELREMKAAGMEIGSHGVTHQSLAELTYDQQLQEINESKRLLDKNLNQTTRYFCYPNGSYNQDTLRLLQEAGFVLAVTIEPGWASPEDNPLLLNRVWLGNSVDLVHFEERLTKQDYSIL